MLNVGIPILITLFTGIGAVYLMSSRTRMSLKLRLVSLAALNAVFVTGILISIQMMGSVGLVQTLAVGGVVAALSVIVTYECVSRFLRPLQQLSTAMLELVEDEVDLTTRMDVARDDEVGELSALINRLIAHLCATIQNVATMTAEVSQAASEIARSSEEAANGAKGQRDQTTQVSAGVEEMSATVVEVAQQSIEASAAAEQAGTRASEGGEVVRETISAISTIAEVVSESSNAVSRLGKRGEEIGQVIEVINDIADQTNLLALNAAIEAARAGEHGRGFAVVADEVRKLAERTTQATKEVAASITAIQAETGEAVDRMNAGTTKVEQGVGLAQQAGEALDRIVGDSTNMARLVQSIAATSEEQAKAADDIARSIESIANVTIESADGAGVAARAADSLSKQSDDLLDAISRFKVEETVNHE